MILGSVVLLFGLSLWLMEEASLLAPVLFPKARLPLGGDGSLQAIFSAVAISGFPLGGLAIRPADASAARALLLTWVALCIVLAATFTCTTIVIFLFDNDGWREMGAEHRQDRILLHAANALVGYYFALRFSRGLSLPKTQALEWAWTTGHVAGATLATVWLGARVWRLSGSLETMQVNWDSLSWMLPSVALPCYMALTSTQMRARLLRWMWAGRRSLISAASRSPPSARPPRSVPPPAPNARPLKSPAPPSKAAADEAAGQATSTLDSGACKIYTSHVVDAGVSIAYLAGSQDDEVAFRWWLHPQLAAFEIVCLAAVFAYFCLQLVLSHAFTELLVVCILVVLLASRISGGWQHRDGENWCVALLVAHVTEAGSVGLGSPDKATAIVAPRIAHRELATFACFVIGLLHGTQPLSSRKLLAVAIVFELVFLFWLVPLVPAVHAADFTHPALVGNGEVTPGYYALVVGCAGGFALGYALMHFVLHACCKPLWHAGREANRRHEQLAAEKDRLYHEVRIAQHKLSKLQVPMAERRSCSRSPTDNSDNGTSSELAGLGMSETEVRGETYPVLPEYSNERVQLGSGVEYFSRSTLREQHLLVVHNGRLVDRSGHPLSPRAPPEGERGIYVLSVLGDMLYSFDARHRHSWLVAGAPVRAAGCLRVRNGELLSIDNSSGHYRPPPASLGVMATWLMEHGLTVANVRIGTATASDSNSNSAVQYDTATAHDGAAAGGERMDAGSLSPIRLVASPICKVARPVAGKHQGAVANAPDADPLPDVA